MTEARRIETHRRGVDPRRCLGWCIFPDGAEWREVELLGDRWTAYGLLQEVTHFVPFPPPPSDGERRK